MRTNILFLIFLIGIVPYGCNNYYDSGLAKGEHDCSIMEYLRNDTQNNWDSAVVIIERAGLIGLFEGTDSSFPKEITFFGFTNYSVLQFLFNMQDEEGNRLYNRISDIPVDLCRQMVLCHVIPGKFLMQDFDYEIKGTNAGGTLSQNMAGTELRIYRIQSSFGGVPDIGAEKLAIHASVSGHKVIVASCNIQMTNGVVHSLRTTYQWSEL